MTIQYSGKYIDVSIVLYTQLTVLPKLDFEKYPFYCYSNESDWKYNNWTITNGLILFSHNSLGKNPNEKELEEIIIQLGKLDPTLHGFIKLQDSNQDLASLNNHTAYIHKGKFVHLFNNLQDFK